MSKPFSPRELVARVKAVLRRSSRTSPTAPKTVIRCGRLSVDAVRRSVSIDGSAIDLTAFQFDLLFTMISAPGRVFTRAELLEMATGESLETYERTIDAHIKNIRKALGESPRAPGYIRTVHGVGYKFDETIA